MSRPRKSRWRRFWPLLLAIPGVLFYLGLLGLAWSLEEAPNYSRIERGLYLGGWVERPPRGTGAVLNLCELEDSYEARVHRWEPIRDAAPAPTLAKLRKLTDFVEEQRQEGRTVYVHCFQGVSRGGLVVVAHLMARHGWTRDEALAFVRERRPGVRPNPAFMELLLEWERHLGLASD